MPTDRRATAVHDRLAALAGGGGPAAHPSRGWVPAAPTDTGAEPTGPRRVVLPFARAGTGPDDGGSDPDEPDAVAAALEPWDDPGTRSRARHRAEVPTAGLVPATVRGGRWRVRPRAALGTLLALAVLAGVLALRAGPPGEGSTVVPARPGSEAGEPTAAAAPGAGSEPVASGPATGPATGPEAAAPVAGAGGGPAGAVLVVHVVGQVRQPGLVRVAAGARVADAVDAAGGATAEADLTRVNLARAVVDGEQLVLPLPGEPVAPQAAPGTPAGGLSGAAAAGGAQVDLNAADLSALDALPGIGPVLAQRILDWRTENGRFGSVDELGEVTGIGDKLLAQLRESVTV